MDSYNIILEVEKKLSNELLNGTYIHNSISMTFKQFLESIFINFVKDGANVDNIVDYINNKLASSVIIKDNEVELPIEKSTTLEESNALRPILDDEVEITLSNGKMIKVYSSEVQKVQYIEDFIANRIDYVDSVRISETEYISVLDTLISKIPYMNDEFKIQVGPNYKTLEDFYLTLLNNSYNPPSFIDKVEICMFYGNTLDSKVLKSTMDGMDISVEEYISRVLPNKMVNATDIIIDGTNINIVDAIKRIEEHQLSIIEAEEKRIQEEKENLYNRTSENPGLLSEINLAINEDNSLEVTTEIPVVSKSKLDESEINAISSLSSGILEDSEEEVYRKLLADLKQAIKGTNNMHDLSAKEDEFKRIAAVAISKNLSTFINSQVISIEELINQRRNEIIKFDGNKEDYVEAIQDHIAELSNQIRLLATIDDFSILNGKVRKLETEVYDKGITDYTLIASLESLSDNLRKARAKFDFKTTEFDVQKSSAIAHINDLVSDLKRKYSTLLYAQEERDKQNAAIAINVKKEQINNALNEYYYKKKIISESEFNQYNSELNVLLQEYNNKNNIGYGYR